MKYEYSINVSYVDQYGIDREARVGELELNDCDVDKNEVTNKSVLRRIRQTFKIPYKDAIKVFRIMRYVSTPIK